MNPQTSFWKIGAIALFILLASYGLYDSWVNSSEFARVSDSIDRKPIRLENTLLEAYAGTYELRPGFAVDISHASGRLYAQATNQQKIRFFCGIEYDFL